jgi:hypothetical protein
MLARIGYHQAETFENSLRYLANNARHETTFDEGSPSIWAINLPESGRILDENAHKIVAQTKQNRLIPLLTCQSAHCCCRSFVKSRIF